MGMAFGLILISLILQAFELINLQIHNENWKLKAAQIETLSEAREIIPASESVIVWGNGGLREWSPYLLQREVLNTEFGLEWQPEEYHQIISANQELDAAENWQDVAQAVRSLSDQKQVYIVLDPGQLPEGFEMTEARPFLVKIKTPQLQIGILELP